MRHLVLFVNFYFDENNKFRSCVDLSFGNFQEILCHVCIYSSTLLLKCSNVHICYYSKNYQLKLVTS